MRTHIYFLLLVGLCRVESAVCSFAVSGPRDSGDANHDTSDPSTAQDAAQTDDSKK